MRVRVGINGKGRVGRAVLRGIAQRPDCAVDVVAVNDVAPIRTLAHLLRYDSTYGRWSASIEEDTEHICVDGHLVRALAEADPTELDWHAHGVDLVVEATGRFRTREQAAAHLAGGARKVVLTAPGTGMDATIVMGSTKTPIPRPSTT